MGKCELHLFTLFATRHTKGSYIGEEGRATNTIRSLMQKITLESKVRVPSVPFIAQGPKWHKLTADGHGSMPEQLKMSH
jgi:hypothetical protein